MADTELKSELIITGTSKYRDAGQFLSPAFLFFLKKKRKENRERKHMCSLVTIYRIDENGRTMYDFGLV